MSIVGGLDIHRAQITFDWCDDVEGAAHVGRINGADRGRLREWLAQFDGVEASFAVEACTGWRYVIEELDRAGIGAHLAETADTQVLRGPRRRAKTDRSDARLLRDLLAQGRLPESWIPPGHVLETRTKMRLYKALIDERSNWVQRLHALCYHQGVPAPGNVSSRVVRHWVLVDAELSPAGRALAAVSYQMIDAINTQLIPLRGELAKFARRQSGCRALMDAHYGIGAICATAIWSELGDCTRFSSSRQAVRHAGIDITVYASDDHRARGHLSRQGPSILRWALYEAALCAARTRSPDHHYYTTVKTRLGHNRATMSVARQLIRRCYHTLTNMGPAAWDPVT